MRYLALAFLGFVVLVVTARPADACPCCGPCNKYKRERIEMPPPVEVYVRVKPAPMPRPARSAKVMALLTGSTWRARKPARARGLNRLRIFDAASIPEEVDPSDAIDNQIVRELELEDGHFVIELGGGRYQVSPCRDHGRVTSCLVRVH